MGFWLWAMGAFAAAVFLWNAEHCTTGDKIAGVVAWPIVVVAEVYQERVEGDLSWCERKVGQP